jgi:UDP-2,3-diacylglucosamine hydrolase
LSFAFVSDLHLDSSDPSAIEQFLEFLRIDAPAAQALYVLGDLFEVWIGDDDRDPARQRVCDALHELSRLGIPVFVMQGNRDVLLGAGFAQRAGSLLLPDPALVELDGQSVLLTHGDLLCTGDPHYQELRSLTRDRRWRQGILALPLVARAALAGAARAGSRKHLRGLRSEIMDVSPDTVAQVLATSGASILVHGHTHRPGMHTLIVDGRPCRRLVLDAWYDAGNALWLKNGEWEFKRWPRLAAPSENETHLPAA